MAQMNISVDTVAKTFTVTIDGQEIPNVVSASAWADRDKQGNVLMLDCSTFTIERDENGVRKTVTYTAEAKAKGAVAGTQYHDIPGFVGQDDVTAIQQAIAEYMMS